MCSAPCEGVFTLCMIMMTPKTGPIHAGACWVDATPSRAA